MRTALKKDEKIVVKIRKHWISLVPPILAWILLVILLFVIGWPGKGVRFVIGLLAAIYPIYEYINWRFNLWTVTNMRVVDESGFFSRHSKESPLDKINNVEYDQSIWGRLFGYGKVEIQTAAEMGDDNYDLIHHPKLLKDSITHAQEEYKKIQISSQATQLAEAIAKSNPMAAKASTQMIADELQKLFELLQKGAITQEEYIAQKNKLMET